MLHRRFSGFALLAIFASAVTSFGTPVTVTELGIGQNEIVNITSSTLNGGNPVNVYAGIVKLNVDGVATDGFCIDPFHWSIGGPQSYNLEPLNEAPKPPGPMGTTAALEIAQLWQSYYSASMTAQNAAGLQIAIWEIVDQAVSGASFTLNSANDYGAATLISSVQSNPSLPTANVVAVSGPGQDYVIHNVGDAASTAGLLAGAFLALAAWFPRSRDRRQSAA